MQKLLCIDDSGKPEDIPTTHWVKKDVIYTLLRISTSKNYPESIIELVEIDLTPYPPYKGFKQSRFIPIDILPMEEVDNAVDELTKELNLPVQ